MVTTRGLCSFANVVLTMLLVFTTTSPTRAAQEYGLEEIRKSIVKVIVPWAEDGTGFVFHIDSNKKNAYIMTAQHVIEGHVGSRQPKIKFIHDSPKSEPSVASVKYDFSNAPEIGSGIDVAILLLKSPPKDIGPLKLSTDFEIGRTAMLIAYPEHVSKPEPSFGRILDRTTDLIKIEDRINITSGKSGGPLLDESRVIGIATKEFLKEGEPQYVLGMSKVKSYFDEYENLKNLKAFDSNQSSNGVLPPWFAPIAAVAIPVVYYFAWHRGSMDEYEVKREAYRKIEEIKDYTEYEQKRQEMERSRDDLVVSWYIQGATLVPLVLVVGLRLVF